MSAQVDGVATPGELDLKEHLTKHGFKQYDKIEEFVNNGDITIEDLIECSVSDLQELCQQHNIQSIQKNRFINAIKKLPNSKASQTQVQQSIVSAMIAETESRVKERIVSLTNLKNENKKNIKFLLPIYILFMHNNNKKIINKNILII